MKFQAIRQFSLAGASGLALALSAQAQAQDAAEEQSASNDDGFNEIVVTAQKRSESVNDVPMAITAVTGDQLVKAGVARTEDLVKIVPSLTVAKSQANTPVYTLRGVGFQTQNLTSTSPVGIYVDEVSYAYPYMASDVAYDLERVEVLKGPQGTLYGRSTTGGVVNFITAKPEQTPGGSMSFEVGNFESYGVKGHFTGPISETLSFRVAGKVELSEKGWQYSMTRPDDRLGEKNRKAVRGSLLWEPSAGFEALLTLSYWKDDSDTQAAQAIAYVPGNPDFPDPRVAQYIKLDRSDSQEAEWTPFDYQPTPSRVRPRPQADARFYGANLRLNYDLADNLTLTSLTSYNDVKRNDVSSTDGVAIEILTAANIASVKSFSQELRLAGESSALNWLVGAYYSHDKLRENQIPHTYDASAALAVRTIATLLKVDPTLAAGILGVPAPFVPGFVALAQYNTAPYSVLDMADGFSLSNFGLEGTAESWAVFGNGELSLTDQLSISLGARYTDTSLKNTGCVYDYNGQTTALGVFLGTVIMQQPISFEPNQCMTMPDDRSGFIDPIKASLNEDNISFRGSINWKPHSDFLAYASVSRGYKAGGFPAIPANFASQLDPVQQERLIAYEGGFKASLADRRIQLNASGFYYDYSDKQVYAKIPDVVFGSLNKLVNVPKAEVYGIETELSARVAQGLRASLAGTWLHSEITEFDGFDNAGNPRDYAGARLTYTPKWTVVGSLDYSTAMTDDLDLNAGISGNYQSASSGRFIGGEATATQAAEDALFSIKARTLFDATVGVGNDAWQLQAFVRNIFDTYYWIAADSQLDTIYRYAGMPRTFGARLTFNF